MSKKPRILSKVIAFLLCFSLIFQQSGFAQIAGQLDISGYIAQLRQSLTTDRFRPLHLRYLSYDNLNNTFKLLLDKGDFQSASLRGAVGAEAISKESKTLLNYFFIGVSLPNDTFWVNLRPDSPDQIIDNALAQTDVGKILLEADLQLKKDTAKFTSPETPEGREYWNKLYQKAGEILGYDNVTIPTLTRPWIVPDEIIIRESKTNAYIYKATLKVMLEQDYLKNSAVYNFKDERLKQLNEYSSQLIRELIIPKITKEINIAKRYAPLRQVYYSLIMAQWFKQKFYGKGGLYSWLIDRKSLAGLTSKEQWSKDTYFKAYQKSFKDGEYNFKEPVQTPFGQSIRSYFSGGIAVTGAPMAAAFAAGGRIDTGNKSLSGGLLDKGTLMGVQGGTPESLGAGKPTVESRPVTDALADETRQDSTPGAAAGPIIGPNHILGPDGEPFVGKITNNKEKRIVMPPNGDLRRAKKDLALAKRIILRVKNNMDVEALENTGELILALDAISQLFEIMDESLKRALPAPLFTVLRYCRNQDTLGKAFNLIGQIGLTVKPKLEELEILLFAADHLNSDNIFTHQVVNWATGDLASLPEECYQAYLHIINRFPRHNEGGVAGIPKDMTFSIELELCLVDGNGNYSVEATQRLNASLRKTAQEKKLIERGWIIKDDAGNIEVTTKAGGLTNDRAGFAELKSGLTGLIQCALDNRQGFGLRQGLHIHIGSPGGISDGAQKAVWFIGKSMEYYWAQLSETGRILEFAPEALAGNGGSGKNSTPFYYDSNTQTIALNTFAPPHLDLFAKGDYFARMQLTIAAALGIVHGAIDRPYEFDILRTGLPVYQGEFYNPGNSYLLRKHLNHLFGANYQGIISMLQLLLDRKALPQLLVNFHDEAANKQKKDFFNSLGLAAIYDVYAGRLGWDDGFIKRVQHTLREQDIPGLRQLAINPKSELSLREAAVYGLRSSADKGHAPAITALQTLTPTLQTLAQDSAVDPGLREAAVYGLRSSADRGHAPFRNPHVGSTEGHVNEAILRAHGQLSGGQINSRQAAEMIIQAILTMPDSLEGIVNMPTAAGILQQAYNDTGDQRYYRISDILQQYAVSTTVDEQVTAKVRAAYKKAPSGPGEAGEWRQDKQRQDRVPEGRERDGPLIQRMIENDDMVSLARYVLSSPNFKGLLALDDDGDIINDNEVKSEIYFLVSDYLSQTQRRDLRSQLLRVNFMQDNLSRHLQRVILSAIEPFIALDPDILAEKEIGFSTAGDLKKAIENSSPVLGESAVLDKLYAAMATRKILCLGERHGDYAGTNFGAQVIRRLNGLTHLFVEIETTFQDSIDDFIKTGKMSDALRERLIKNWGLYGYPEILETAREKGIQIFAIDVRVLHLDQEKTDKRSFKEILRRIDDWQSTQGRDFKALVYFGGDHVGRETYSPDSLGKRLKEYFKDDTYLVDVSNRGDGRRVEMPGGHLVAGKIENTGSSFEKALIVCGLQDETVGIFNLQHAQMGEAYCSLVELPGDSHRLKNNYDAIIHVFKKDDAKPDQPQPPSGPGAAAQASSSIPRSSAAGIIQREMPRRALLISMVLGVVDRVVGNKYLRKESNVGGQKKKHQPFMMDPVRIEIDDETIGTNVKEEIDRINRQRLLINAGDLFEASYWIKHSKLNLVSDCLRAAELFKRHSELILRDHKTVNEDLFGLIGESIRNEFQQKKDKLYRDAERVTVNGDEYIILAEQKRSSLDGTKEVIVTYLEPRIALCRVLTRGFYSPKLGRVCVIRRAFDLIIDEMIRPALAGEKQVALWVDRSADPAAAEIQAAAAEIIRKSFEPGLSREEIRSALEEKTVRHEAEHYFTRNFVRKVDVLADRVEKIFKRTGTLDVDQYVARLFARHVSDELDSYLLNLTGRYSQVQLLLMLYTLQYSKMESEKFQALAIIIEEVCGVDFSHGINTVNAGKISRIIGEMAKCDPRGLERRLSELSRRLRSKYELPSPQANSVDPASKNSYASALNMSEEFSGTGNVPAALAAQRGPGAAGLAGPSQAQDLPNLGEKQQRQGGFLRFWLEKKRTGRLDSLISPELAYGYFIPDQEDTQKVIRYALKSMSRNKREKNKRPVILSVGAGWAFAEYQMAYQATVIAIEKDQQTVEKAAKNYGLIEMSPGIFSNHGQNEGFDLTLITGTANNAVNLVNQLGWVSIPSMGDSIKAREQELKDILKEYLRQCNTQAADADLITLFQKAQSIYRHLEDLKANFWATHRSGIDLAFCAWMSGGIDYTEKLRDAGANYMILIGSTNERKVGVRSSKPRDLASAGIVKNSYSDSMTGRGYNKIEETLCAQDSSIMYVYERQIKSNISKVSNGIGILDMPSAEKGGIDFRGMPIVTQPVLIQGQSPLNNSLKITTGTVPMSLEKEWQEIQRMLAADITPSTQRIKEYMLACCRDGCADKEVGKVLGCIADILRIEEERGSATDVALKKILTALEQNDQVSGLGVTLAKISVSPGEPQLVPVP